MMGLEENSEVSVSTGKINSGSNIVHYPEIT